MPIQPTRRELLVHGCQLATLVASSRTLPGFLTGTANAATPARDPERILVVIQLTGGNDGLNTVIPYEDDAYHAARPTLRVPRNQVLRLDDRLALHPNMEGLKQLFDDGSLAVLNNVGYPNPDRSHFRSMDIWHAATLDPDAKDTGWLGRVADQLNKQHASHNDRSRPPAALHLDNGALPRAVRAATAPVPSITGIDALRLDADTDELRRRLGSRRANASDDLRFVQRVAVSSCEQAARLEHVLDDRETRRTYPPFALANRLQQIAQLIGAGFGARVYYTSIGGFDTHARQELAHPGLLRQLSDSVAAFQRDLTDRGIADRVLTMTFSEFGRRVKENGSRGTDHGAAAPMFIVGEGITPGLHGDPPDLANLVQGDVPHAVDFRNIYASLLDDWLAIDHRPILGQTFDAPRLIA